MSGEMAERVVAMANQIARNLAFTGESEAVAATAAHIRSFWDPRMIAALKGADSAALSPIARQAAGTLL